VASWRHIQLQDNVYVSMQSRAKQYIYIDIEPEIIFRIHTVDAFSRDQVVNYASLWPTMRNVTHLHLSARYAYKTSCAGGRHTMPPPKVDRQRLALGGGVEYGVVRINYVVTWTVNQSGLVTLTFDLLTLKVVSESRVTWATSVPILVFLGLSVFD